jgi:hypothetical protein
MFSTQLRAAFRAFGYTALHYTVDIDCIFSEVLESKCMVCLCTKYHNSVTNLLSLAFQQLKSIGTGICMVSTSKV